MRSIKYDDDVKSSVIYPTTKWLPAEETDFEVVLVRSLSLDVQ